MRKTLLGIFILCLFLSLSCTEATKTVYTDSKLKVNLDTIPKEEELLLSSFVKREDCSIVLLDTVSDALMGEINKLSVCEDYIITLDRNVYKGVLTFDKDGRFLRKIGQKGQGPGEYVSPSDFAYSIDEDKIFVLDSQLRKIMIYRFSTGFFLKDIRIEPYALRVHYYKGNLYVVNPSYGQYKTDNLLARVNTETGECEEYMINPKIFNAGYDGSLSNEGGSFLQSGTSQFKL